MAEKLPEEMMEEVVLRLPAKSLGRFRCVSKTWRSRLSSPRFVRAHSKFHIHSGPVSIIFEYEIPHFDFMDFMDGMDYEPRRISEIRRRYYNNHQRDYRLLTFAAGGGSGKLVTSPLFEQKQVSAAAGFHGLVVVEIETGGENSMFLFNPITLEALKLPQFRPSNPYECCHFLGLGYDSLNDDYKIVRLSYSEHHYKRKHDGTFVDVYSFKRQAWRKKRKSPYNHEFSLPPNPGVFVNGCLHWLARVNEDSSSYVIAAFDLAKEEFKEVPSPPKGSSDSCEVVEVSDDSCEVDEDSDDGYEDEGFDDSCEVDEDSDDGYEDEGFDDSCEVFEGFDDSCQVIVFGGCLAVVGTPTNDWIDDRVDVWVMKEYGVQESWNKIMIDTNDRGIGKFVCLLREDEVVFRQSHVDDKQFAAYSLSTGVWRDIEVAGDQYECLNIEEETGVVAFTECLLSPNHLFD